MSANSRWNLIQGFKG